MFNKKDTHFFSQYETTDKHLQQDGKYVPRIIFVGKPHSYSYRPVTSPCHRLCYLPSMEKVQWLALSPHTKKALDLNYVCDAFKHFLVVPVYQT